MPLHPLRKMANLARTISKQIRPTAGGAHRIWWYPGARWTMLLPHLSEPLPKFGLPRRIPSVCGRVSSRTTRPRHMVQATRRGALVLPCPIQLKSRGHFRRLPTVLLRPFPVLRLCLTTAPAPAPAHKLEKIWSIIPLFWGKRENKQQCHPLLHPLRLLTFLQLQFLRLLLTLLWLA